jgi:putative membrane protein
MMWNGFGYGYGAWGGMLFMGIFWVLVIGLIIWGISRMGRQGHMMHGDQSGSNAFEIAKERYAKGEIDQQEFEKLKKNLS